MSTILHSRASKDRRIGPARHGPWLAVVVFAALALAAAARADARSEAGRVARAAFPRSLAGRDEVFDIRETGSRRRRVVRAAGRARRSQRALRRSLGDEAVLDIDRLTGTPRVIARRDGFLTSRSSRSPRSIALGYVRRHDNAIGLDRDDLDRLKLVREYTSASGITHLQWAQTFRGIPALDNELTANVAGDGRLINVLGSPRPDLALDSVQPRLAPGNAVRRAMHDVGASGRVEVSGRSRGAEQITRFKDGHQARLVLFGEAGRVRLAWRVLLFADSRHIYDSVIDAASGAVLRRRNLVLSATGKAFDYFPGAISGGSQVTKSFSTSGNDPWLTDVARLKGNNTHTHSDVNDDIYTNSSGPLPQAADEIAPSSGTDWDYAQTAAPPNGWGQSCPAVGCTWDTWWVGSAYSWAVNREQNGTQVFYWVNTMHDHLRDAPGIGFDEASGNFEQTNTTGQGLGGDPVLAQVDDGADTHSLYAGFPDAAHTNNANMATLPDGTSPRMQMYLFTGLYSTGVYDVNGGDDAGIVYHEYVHGLSNRLITDAAGQGALSNAQSGAMGEAWSDWYAMDLLVEQGFQPDDPATAGDVVLGVYVNASSRTQPMDCPAGGGGASCPGAGTAGPGGYTYGDFGKIGGGPEVHADGEIWASTLWDLRTTLIAAHGASEGLWRVRALVTDGMRLSPAQPSFLDMRNAILQADTNRGFGDRARIWGVFAARGMGYHASTTGSNDVSPVEDFTIEPQPVPAPAPDTTAPVISSLRISRRFAPSRKSTPRRLTAAASRVRRGTTIRYTLSEDATVRITVQQRRRGIRMRRSAKSRRRCVATSRKNRRTLKRLVRRSLRRKRLSPRQRRRRISREMRRARCIYYKRKGRLERSGKQGVNKVPFSGRIGRRRLPRGRCRVVVTATDAAGNTSKAKRKGFRVVSATRKKKR